MLLGKDDVILDVAPAYVTDALARKVNVDRYDDREIIKTNLIESYEQLMQFARKHLPDKFYVEGDQRKSLRDIITREMLVNSLIHREFSSPYVAKYIIEQDKMYVENANRAVNDGILTPENLEPNPKNPIIAAFFRNIGYSDQLGSGVRNLFKYTKLYSGQEPVFREGDIFRIIVPLDDAYSYDYGNIGNTSADKVPIKVREVPISDEKVPISDEKVPISPDEDGSKVPINGKHNSKNQRTEILVYIVEHGKITTQEAAALLQVKPRRARNILAGLVNDGMLKKNGAYKSTVYVMGENIKIDG
jgi:ATP-dependent DNA helicase RecG